MGTGDGAEGLSRRTLLKAAAALPLIPLAGPSAALAATATLRRASSLLLQERLPTASALQRDVERMVGFGQRLTATAPHRAFIDWIDLEMQRAGLCTGRDTYSFMQWLARGWSLDIADGPGAGRVPVAAYYTYSGNTGPAGVTGPLAYIGPLPVPSLAGNPLELADFESALRRSRAAAASALAASLAAVPGGVRGKVVLLECPVAPLSIGDFDPILSYRHDPEGTLRDTEDYKRVWTTILTIAPLAPLLAAGAAGAVFILDAAAANAEGQYTPFIDAYQGLPALIVDREVGARLRAAAAAAPTVKLVLDATYVKRTSDSLYAVLPGDGSTGEVILLNTHTDGMNAFEENGGVGLVHAARYLASLPPSARRRNVVFSAVTGHFGPGLPQTQGFIDAHPDIIARTVAAVTVEHFGALEWLDDVAAGYHPSGLTEPGVAFHSQTPILASAIASTRAADLRRTELLRPLGTTFFGVGAALHAAGIPSVAYIGGPNYLLGAADHGHLDKFLAARMEREVAWTIDLVRRLDAVPAMTLAAGDSAVLRKGVAVSTPLPAQRGLTCAVPGSTAAAVSNAPVSSAAGAAPALPITATAPGAGGGIVAAAVVLAAAALRPRRPGGRA